MLTRVLDPHPRVGIKAELGESAGPEDAERQAGCKDPGGQLRLGGATECLWAREGQGLIYSPTKTAFPPPALTREFQPRVPPRASGPTQQSPSTYSREAWSGQGSKFWLWSLEVLGLTPSYTTSWVDELEQVISAGLYKGYNAKQRFPNGAARRQS